MTKQKSGKLRHGARSLKQERQREDEMREAVRTAECRAADEYQRIEGWRTTQSYDQLKASARAAAREDVRAKWAREDAEFEALAKAYPPHINRITTEGAETMTQKEPTFTVDEIRQWISRTADEIEQVAAALGTDLQRDGEGFITDASDLGIAVRELEHATSAMTRLSFALHRRGVEAAPPRGTGQ
jgi:hypothetical protein